MMRVEDLRGYGVAVSDLEALWPPELKARMKRDGVDVVMSRLGFVEKLRFCWAFLGARRRAAALDLSDLRARGLNNETFFATQREYLALFSALVSTVGTERALAIGRALMEAIAKEPMLRVLPDADELRSAGEPFAVFREYLAAMPAAACRAGCQELVLHDEPDVVGFDVTWCAWLELARKMGVPEAAIPECYADEIAFPEYFRALGMEYRRTQTLAEGARCCDFRFARGKPREPSAR